MSSNSDESSDSLMFSSTVNNNSWDPFSNVEILHSNNLVDDQSSSVFRDCNQDGESSIDPSHGASETGQDDTPSLSAID